MDSVKRYIISFTLFLLAINLPAQNITGTWEGELENDQFMQLNIIQTGDKICGYTYDHVNKDQRSYCKAFFEGYFDKTNQKLVISGKYFLENSGGHFLMNIIFNYKKEKGVEILEVKPTGASVLSSLLSTFGIIIEPEPFEEGGSNVGYARIKKVSGQPYEIIELMKDCIAQDKKQPDTVVKKIIPPKIKNNTPPIVKTVPPKPKDSIIVKNVPPKKRDSIYPATPPLVIKKEPPPLPKTFSERKNKEQSRITVDVKTINLKVYDNAIMDGDTVSILYNGKLLLSHQLLSEKGIEINLELDDKQTRHEIVLFAENLGSIPPNTALVVITAGTKRYELFASANLEENAVLVFDYRPK
ncbi:MAG: hypothetical protein ABIO79_09300 [Ferruginibacter sp.]